MSRAQVGKHTNRSYIDKYIKGSRWSQLWYLGGRDPQVFIIFPYRKHFPFLSNPPLYLIS